MKFKFIGKPNLIIDTLKTGHLYRILQFEHTSKYLCIYVVDEKNKILCIPYSNMERFNENWSYMNND